LKRKYYKYRYGKHPDKKTKPLEIIGYAAAYILVMMIGVGYFVLERDILWITRKVAGILWFSMGLIGLIFFGNSIRIEGKYLLIDDEKLIWKPSLFQKRNEILLKTIERTKIEKSKIILFLEDRTQFEIDKTKIISTKKKKELDRIIGGLINE